MLAPQCCALVIAPAGKDRVDNGLERPGSASLPTLKPFAATHRSSGAGAVNRTQLSRISLETMVPLAGIEPALLAELDFESSASTNSATGAFFDLGRTAGVGKPAEYSGRRLPVNPV
jgi:hypothetical protein